MSVIFVWLALEWVLLPNPADLKLRNPSTTAFMRISDRQRSAQGLPNSRKGAWMRLDEISIFLREAVLVSEDDAFFMHEGVDYTQVKEVLKESIESKKLTRGASTITQQTARNLYLSPSKNPLRKLKELILTKRIEKALSKERILEIYLNIAEWGDGIFGCDLAARTYFGHGCRVLTPEEGALLAAMLPNPIYLDPRVRPEKIEWKRNWILKRLREKRILSQEDYQQAKRKR